MPLNAHGSLRHGPVVVGGSWASIAGSSFHHAIEGIAGPVRLTLETCSSASSGEPVTIYQATGYGRTKWKKVSELASLSVPAGEVRTGKAAIAPRSSISGVGTLYLAVVVENPTGRSVSGAYRLTIDR